MFSTQAAAADGGPATATRSRRRQRPKSTDSLVQQPKAKRQRLPLTEQTFLNPDAPQEMIEVKNDKIAKTASADSKEEGAELFQQQHPRQATPRRESSNLKARKSKHGDRAANRGDGTLLLTSTNAYTVSKLPALPDRIRNDWSGPQRAELVSSYGYALTLTPAHAIVWPYTSASQSPETFTFTLPSASRPSDPLPVASLVSPSASSTEPGLVVVMAGTGKVVYWESISAAATFPFIKRDRSGVEYMISGMSSGEKVSAVTNAESAGFILTFNTGRLAYMNVRDGYGRPSVSVQFLRTTLAGSGTGLFGSIRHAFQNLSIRGDIVAARADRSTRVGERNVVALTTKGRVQGWRIHRGGHNEPSGDADMREEIVEAIHQEDQASRLFSADSFEALDFTFTPTPEERYGQLSRLSNAIHPDDPFAQQLLVLVSLTRKNTSRYVLVEVILNPQGGKVGMVRPIAAYSTRSSLDESTDTVRPRLYLPRPGLVAFLVFDRAVVVASIAEPPETPDSQLQSDSHILPASFEDVIDFREDDTHEVLGSGFEEISIAGDGPEYARPHRHKARNPAALLLIRGAGVMRILTTDSEKFASDQPPQISAKSKLEQAVFFGAKQDNPLVFDRRQGRDIVFGAEEVRDAAREISHEILSSTSSFTSTLPASMEENLMARAEALERLAWHLNAVDADLDNSTRWQLLWNAEKMQVASVLWKLHEKFTTNRPASDKKSLIVSIVEYIHQDQKTAASVERGEVDRVRHWFVNDVFRLEIFVAWAYEVIKVLYRERFLDDAKVTVMMHEAMQVMNATHTTALEFRRRNVSLYGLSTQKLKMGILEEGYEGLSEPWTGCHYIANNLKRMSDLVGQWIAKNSDVNDKGRTPSQPDPTVISQLMHEMPTLVDGLLTHMLEYARWASAQEGQSSLGDHFIAAYETDRVDKTVAAAHFGNWNEAAYLARKHQATSALATILLDHIERLETDLLDPGLSRQMLQAIKSEREAKKLEVEEAFIEYGTSFAFPLYNYLLDKHGVDAVMSFKLDKHGYATKYMRSKPELARISWINDIQAEHDLGRAACTLVELALHKEQQVWNKKIELSLGKLAMMAEEEEVVSAAASSNTLKHRNDDTRRQEDIDKVNRELTALRIQDQLYGLVVPSTYAAVDEAAALNMAMEVHGSNLPRRQKAIHQLFEEGMKRLLRHEALDAMTMIDLLTLISLPEDARETIPHPFWLALIVAENICHRDELKDAKRLVWRRLLIRDDWAKLNDTQLKGDREVLEGVVETELYSAFADCIQNEDRHARFTPPNPVDSLGTYTKSLDRRFRDFDASFCNKVHDAMKQEDKLLTQYLEKNRLRDWVNETYKTAKEDVRLGIDEATAQGAYPEEDVEAIILD